jgi:hypothetical protein
MTYSKGFGATIVLIAIGILIAVAGVGIIWQKRAAMQSSQASVVPTSVAKQTAMPTTGAGGTTSVPTPTLGDTSDKSIDQDLTNTSSKVNSVDTESTAIDQGLNDKMGDLSE